jgi:hypothetical protein
LTGTAMFPDKTKNPSSLAGDGFGKFTLYLAYELNLPSPATCVIPTWRCQAARFGIQFILAMINFIVRTRQCNPLPPMVNAIFIQPDDLLMLTDTDA